MKQRSWLALASFLAIAALTFPAMAAPAKVVSVEKAMVEETPEAQPDPTLRDAGKAANVITADGSTIESAASHLYLMDYATGTVLAEKAGDAKMYPSSMTKLMTLYLLFDRLKQGTLALDNQFTVSERAWRMQGSKMFVPLGGQIPLEELLRGIAIQSGNDACVVVAEGIAGSEEAFARQMTEKAKELGMTHSSFKDASGWPHPDHYTTAHDLAMLSRALIRDFPQYYHYLAEREFTYHGIRQFNRNLLLANTALGVDGLKTGHTEAAGYGIALSAKQAGNGRRLVLVINGLASESERAAEGERLLNWGFHNFDNLRLFAAGQQVTKAAVWMGKEKTVPLVVADSVVLSVPKIGRDAIKLKAEYNAPVKAPIKKGDELGVLKITLASGEVREAKLVAGADVEKLSFFGRIPRKLGF